MIQMNSSSVKDCSHIASGSRQDVETTTTLTLMGVGVSFS